MKKDLQSFYVHDKQYKQKGSLEYEFKINQEYENKNIFNEYGFKKIIENLNNIGIHIDIGCGTGWLIKKTSSYFNKVIGIEPSQAAIDIAKIITKDCNNIIFINKDMTEAFDQIKFEKPVFITSAIVFSHIKNNYVSNFLKLLKKLPNGSILFFDEPYDKHIYQPLWYIRNKSWWAKNLPDFELTFLNNNINGYLRGIYGIKIGRNKVVNKYKTNLLQKIIWQIDLLNNYIKLIKRKL